jgi:flagellar assembly protein FliH
MSAARPVKFGFGQEFGLGDARRKAEEAERERERRAAEVAAAEARGRAAGYAAGQKDREVAELGRIAAALDRLAGAASDLLGSLAAERRAVEAEAVEVALAVGRTLARGLVAREPEHEIARLVGEALAVVRRAPHLAIRVAPDLVESVRARVERIAFERGFEGRLVVLGDPDAALGDCRIEWADGGVVRDSAALAAAVSTSVDDYLAARAAGEPE